MPLRKTIQPVHPSETANGNLMKVYFDSGHQVLRAYEQSRRLFPSLPSDVGPTTIESHHLYYFVCGGDGDSRNPKTVEQAEMLHWQARWCQAGAPTFQLTHSLAAALTMTQSDALTWGDFRLPHDAMLITLPYPDGPITMFDADGETVIPARWIILHRHTKHADHDRQAINDGYGEAVERSRDSGDLTAVGEFLSACRERPSNRTRILYRLVAESGISVFGSCIEGDPEHPITDWLRRLIAESDLPLELDRYAAQATTRLVANLCVYLTSERGEKEWDPKAPKRSNRHGQPMPTVHNVGSAIKLPKGLREAARAYCQKGKRPEAWKLQSRYTVRGHWRRQAHGEKRSLRRLMWIEPHWKGPEAAESMTRLYEVAERGPAK